MSCSVSEIPMGNTFSMVANLASIELEFRAQGVDKGVKNLHALLSQVEDDVVVSADMAKSYLLSNPAVVAVIGSAMSDVDPKYGEIGTNELLQGIKEDFLNKISSFLDSPESLTQNEMTALRKICLALSKKMYELKMESFSQHQGPVWA